MWQEVWFDFENLLIDILILVAEQLRSLRSSYTEPPHDYVIEWGDRLQV
jgi:hypothetical protein